MVDKDMVDKIDGWKETGSGRKVELGVEQWNNSFTSYFSLSYCD